MKFRQSSHKTQAFSKEIPINKAELQDFCQNNTKSKNKLLNSLIYLTNKYQHVTCTVTYLAIRCGVTKQTIRRWLRELELMGILKTCYRVADSSVYRLHGILFTQTMRTALASWIPSLLVQAFLPLSILLSSCQVALSSPSIKKGIYINSMLAIAIQERETYSNRETIFLTKLEPETCARTSKEAFSKRKLVMNEFKREKFNINVSQFVGLKLTAQGALELSQYPDHILKEVGMMIEGSNKDFSNPYAYVAKQCMQLCKQENIIPDRATINEKWQLLKWPDRYTAPKYDESNPYINPPKPKNGNEQRASTYKEWTGHTLPKDYKHKTMWEETSQEMIQKRDTHMKTEVWKEKLKKNPSLMKVINEYYDVSIATRKELEREERGKQAERITNESEQMRIG